MNPPSINLWFYNVSIYVSSSMVSYKKQELFTLRENLISPHVLVGSVLLIFLDFCVVICLSSSYVLLSKCSQCLRTVHSWLLLRFSLTFIFASKTTNSMLSHLWFKHKTCTIKTKMIVRSLWNLSFTKNYLSDADMT